MKVNISFNEQYDVNGYDDIPTLIRTKVLNVQGGKFIPPGDFSMIVQHFYWSDTNDQVPEFSDTYTITEKAYYMIMGRTTETFDPSRVSFSFDKDPIKIIYNEIYEGSDTYNQVKIMLCQLDLGTKITFEGTTTQGDGYLVIKYSGTDFLFDGIQLSLPENDVEPSLSLGATTYAYFYMDWQVSALTTTSPEVSGVFTDITNFSGYTARYLREFYNGVILKFGVAKNISSLSLSCRSYGVGRSMCLLIPVQLKEEEPEPGPEEDFDPDNVSQIVNYRLFNTSREYSESVTSLFSEQVSSDTDFKRNVYNYTAESDCYFIIDKNSRTVTNTSGGDGYVDILLNDISVYKTYIPSSYDNPGSFKVMSDLEPIRINTNDNIKIAIGFDNSHTGVFFDLYWSITIVNV